MARTICSCNKVTEEEVKKMLQKSPLATLTDVARYSGASMSCGRCRTELAAVISEVRNNSSGDHHAAMQLVIPFDR